MNDSKREKAMEEVKMYLTSGWEIKDENTQYFLLTKRNNSCLIHGVLFLFTAGIGNVLYYFLNVKKKKIYKL